MTPESSPKTTQQAAIDAHRHVWDQSKVSYPWLASRPDMPVVTSSEEISGLLGHGGLVLVEAGAHPGDEDAEFALMLSAVQMSQVPARIVSALPGGADWAQRLQRRAEEHSSLAGVRIGIPERPDAQVIAEQIATASGCNLAVDLLVADSQLPFVLRSGVLDGASVVVIDHSGNPPVRSGLDTPEGQQWLECLEELSGQQNVVFKISGFPPLADPRRPLLDQSAPFMKVISEYFPAERLMVGSDWPVSSTHPDITGPGCWAALVETILGSGYDDDIAWRTAARVYGF